MCNSVHFSPSWMHVHISTKPSVITDDHKQEKNTTNKRVHNVPIKHGKRWRKQRWTTSTLSKNTKNQEYNHKHHCVITVPEGIQWIFILDVCVPEFVKSTGVIFEQSSNMELICLPFMMIQKSFPFGTICEWSHGNLVRSSPICCSFAVAISSQTSCDTERDHKEGGLEHHRTQTSQAPASFVSSSTRLVTWRLPGANVLAQRAGFPIVSLLH